jgi:hypothetical protein
LSIRVELLEHGTVVAEGWLVAADIDRLALTSSISKARKRFYGSSNLKVPADGTDRSAWVLRLTGKSDYVHYLWDAEQWWSGTMTIPWNEAVVHETARVAPNGRGPEVSTPHFR